MLRRFIQFIFCAALLLAAGCAARPGLRPVVFRPDDNRHEAEIAAALRTSAHLFPARFRATHHAIVTVLGRQFTCDGLLEVSPGAGDHLALASSFGVVTDLRVNTNGATELLKVTPLFRPDWATNYVTRDLRCLFISPVGLHPAGFSSNGGIVLSSDCDLQGRQAMYVFTPDGRRWLELELLQRGQPYYHAAVKYNGPYPSQFDVWTKRYQLELRSYLEARP